MLRSEYLKRHGEFKYLRDKEKAKRVIGKSWFSKKQTPQRLSILKKRVGREVWIFAQMEGWVT